MASLKPFAEYTAEEIEKIRSLMSPEERAEFDTLLLPTRNDIEKDWRTWLTALFPHLTRGELSFFQIEYMEWLWNALWAKRKGMPLPDNQNAFISVWSRGHAKSSFARIAPIMEAAILGQGYCLYVCHEKGTQVYTEELGRWHKVEEHPTAREVEGHGLDVRVWGLPFAETVTIDHRYWARTVSRRDRGHGKPPVHTVSDPKWTRALFLTENTWIGYPVDQTISTDFPKLRRWLNAWHYIDEVPSEFYDPEWWWLFGLWWGDGSLGGCRRSQIAITVADTDRETLERLRALLKRTRGKWGEARGSNCTIVYFGHSVIARWLHSWKQGNSRKVPPAWVERLPQDYLAPLVRGYVDADGHKSARSVSVVSIHLEGLLALRRILMRMGIAGTISPKKSAGTELLPSGRCRTQNSYALKFAAGSSLLEIALPLFRGKYKHPPCYVENGILWSRVRGVKKSEKTTFVPIQTASVEYLTAFGRSHNSGNQDQANKHLGSIETLLTSPQIRHYYPQLAAPQTKNTDRGTNKAWNQKMLHLQVGYVIQAIGLDVGIRGANIDDMRISLEVPDDIDERDDTIIQAEQKMDKFLHSVLPAKKAGTLFICAQNLVIEHGVVNRIVTGAVPALANARISGPHERVKNLKTEKKEINGRQRDIVLSGDVTWPGNDSLERIQEDIDTYTLPVFLRECQHQLAVDRTGLVLSPWDDSIHVITESEFAAIFDGHRKPPPSWNKEILHDWAQSKSAYHANVVLKLAVSSQNTRLPGCMFLYDPMSFEENTQADDVAIRILESITPRVSVNGSERTWKEILDAEFARLNLEKFVSSATTLIAARREILAHIIPPLVGPLLQRHGIRRLKMSHEAKTQRNVYRRIYGLSFTGVNPRKEGGLEFANHYLRIFYDRQHPFKDKMGWSQMYLIVPDEKAGYPLALRPDSLHDHDLIRYQFSHWRHTAPNLTTTGILEHGPEKMNDDFGNCLQMSLINGGLAAEPLSYQEKIEELIPAGSRLENIMRDAPMSMMGRKTMSARDQISYELARQHAQSQIQPSHQQFDEWLNPID